MGTLEKQNEFLQFLLDDLPERWDSIDIHFEYYWHEDEEFVIDISGFSVAGEEEELDLSVATLKSLIELNSCIPDGQAGRWTWLEFHMEKSGKYSFKYKYGMPPQVAENLACR